MSVYLLLCIDGFCHPSGRLSGTELWSRGQGEAGSGRQHVGSSCLRGAQALLVAASTQHTLGLVFLSTPGEDSRAEALLNSTFFL